VRAILIKKIVAVVATIVMRVNTCEIAPGAIGMWEEMRELHKQAEKQINPVEDNVRFYWLTPEAVKNSLTLDSLPPQEPPSLYIF